MTLKINKIETQITIEEAKKRGLWKIVNQLENDKKARQGLGLKPLQVDIAEPTPGIGRPKKKK